MKSMDYGDQTAYFFCGNSFVFGVFIFPMDIHGPVVKGNWPEREEVIDCFV